jgi:Uma2 family endonuclease
MALPIPKLTPEQYLAIEREAEYKSEYFYGEMYAMAGASKDHLQIESRLVGLLFARLDSQGCRVYTADARVRVNDQGLFMYPDVTVVCGKPVFGTNKGDVLLNPKVIFEVLSPSTEAKDRGFRFHLYQEIPTLLEYVLVSQSEALIERFWRVPEGEWSGYSKTQGLDATLKLGSLDIAIPLADIYRGVEFETPSI